MSEPPTLPPGASDAWDTPVEAMLERYLEAPGALAADADRAALRERLRAVIRAEPIARGCPSLAMLRAADLAVVRSHLELLGTVEARLEPQEIEATLRAFRDFLDWARAAHAHALSAVTVAEALGLDPRV